MHSSKSSFFRWLQGARQQVGRQLQAEMDRESMAPELTLRPGFWKTSTQLSDKGNHSFVP